MPDLSIPLRGDATAIRNYLRRLPAMLSGRTTDPQQLGRTFKTLFAVNVLDHISKAFAIKAAGGTDDLGDKWRPLKRSTIAQRPVGVAEKKALGITGKRERGLLTPAQNARWKGIFAGIFRKLAPRVGEAEAKATAAKIAWSILKREGAMTKLDVLGGRNVLIHRVTDRLYRSLSVGSFLFAAKGTVNYRPHPDQVLDVDRANEIVIGTKVPYAEHVHKLRRLWPPSIRKWVLESLEAAGAEVQRLVSR